MGGKIEPSYRNGSLFRGVYNRAPEAIVLGLVFGPCRLFDPFPYKVVGVVLVLFLFQNFSSFFCQKIISDGVNIRLPVVRNIGDNPRTHPVNQNVARFRVRRFKFGHCL